MTAGNPWLTLIIGLVSGGGLAAIISAIRDSRSAYHKDERDTQDHSVAMVNALWQQAKTANDEVGVARADARTVRAEMDSMRADIEGLLDRVAQLEDEVRALETERHRLVGWVTVVMAGVSAGTIPPLPPVPPDVAAILSHITTTTQEQP